MKLFNQKQLENIKMACKDDTRPHLNGLFIEGNSTIATDGHRLMKVSFNPEPLKKKVLYKELGEDFADDKELGKSLALEKYNKKMAMEWPANGVKWDTSTKPFTLPRSTVEKALKNIPKKVDMAILKNVAIGLEFDKKGKAVKAVCQTTDLENTDNVQGRLVDGKFPNYKQVLPDFENGDYQRVSVNAKYLKEVCAQLEKYNDGNHPIILHLKKDKLSCSVENDRESSQFNPFFMPVIEAELGEHFSMGVTADDKEGTDAVAVIMPVRI